MEILFNELSLTGQFASREQFVNDTLPQIAALINEIDGSTVFYKNRDFYASLVTPTDSIHDILIGNISRQYKEIIKFKRQFLQLFHNPFWEDDRKHVSTDAYDFNGKSVCDKSMAEACERDKVIISFTHQDFSELKLTVVKNRANDIELDNLFAPGHYISIARQRGIIVDFTLKDATRFSKTRLVRQGQPVYKEISTNCYWYLDNLHKNHYEVFDSEEVHIGIADKQGIVDTTKRKDDRRL